jgi:hypothetical protein
MPATTGYVTVTSAGNLPHADATDRTGVPTFDGADAGNHDATYVEIIDNATGQALTDIATGANRIYGRVLAGTATDGNAIEIHFRKVAQGAVLSSSTAYTWEAGQPTVVDLYYPYRERLDLMSETALRTTLINGIVGDAGVAQDISDIRTVLGISDGDTFLEGLTNTTASYVFSLLDGTPSVTEALNALNGQIGNRDYTGSVLTDGQTITASLQALSNAISSSSVTRVIERLSSQITAGTAHTLPGGNTYTLDGTNNGLNLSIYWRGVLKDPGPVVDGNDYAETSTTSFTPYQKINANDHINYYILQ